MIFLGVWQHVTNHVSLENRFYFETTDTSILLVCIHFEKNVSEKTKIFLDVNIFIKECL